MLKKIPLELLKDNPLQPRFDIKIDDESTIDLANSIKENGLLQPIKVSASKDGHYTIIFGHRRVMAHKRLGLQEIEAIVVNIDENSTESRINALIENIQRENLNPIEIAKAYKDALDSGLTLDELSTKLGKSKPVIVKATKYYSLDDRIKDYYTNHSNAKKDANVLYEISNCIKEGDAQWEVFQIYQNEKMKRDELLRLIANYKEKKAITKELDVGVNVSYDHQGIKLRANFLTALTTDKKTQLEKELKSLLDKYRI